MKKDIHPDYREVVFQDVQSDFKFLTRSTIKSEETIKWEDGKEYPLVKVEVSSASHPFYTGKKIFVDTAGRVDKFNKKYQSLQAAKDVADKKIKEEKSEPKVKNEISENSAQEKEINIGEISEDVSSKEIKDEPTPAAEESKEEAPVVEGSKEEAPAVEGSKEEAPAVEESKEEAPAAEESKEEAPAADSTSEDTQKEDS